MTGKINDFTCDVGLLRVRISAVQIPVPYNSIGEVKRSEYLLIYGFFSQR